MNKIYEPNRRVIDSARVRSGKLEREREFTLWSDSEASDTEERERKRKRKRKRKGEEGKERDRTVEDMGDGRREMDLGRSRFFLS